MMVNIGYYKVTIIEYYEVIASAEDGMIYSEFVVCLSVC